MKEKKILASTDPPEEEKPQDASGQKKGREKKILHCACICPSAMPHSRL